MNDCISFVDSEHKRKVISISMLSSMEFSPRIRELVLSVIRNNTSFSSRWACRLQSVIDELVNNAIEHGSDGNSLVTITIFLSTVDGSLEVTIADMGTGKKKTTAAILTKKMRENYEIMKINPLLNTSVRGRWLAQIVLNWSDVFDIQDNNQGGLTTKITKYLTPDCQEPPKKEEAGIISPKAMIDIEVSAL